MPTTPYKIARGQFGLSLTDPAKPVADAAIADYTDFSCKVIGARVTTDTQITQDTPPLTLCGAGETVSSVTGETFALDITALQDPNDTSGLAAFLWDHRTAKTGNPLYFYLSLAEDAAPKVIGKILAEPLDFGGDAGTVLQSSLTFTIDGTPDMEFGAAADA